MKTCELKRLLQTAAVLSAVGMISAAQADPPVVQLRVNEDQTKLEWTTPGNCIRDNKPGCIRVSGKALINFNLIGSANCSLDHVALGDPGNINEVAAADFNADMTSGRVTPVNQNDRHIQIRDNNTKKYDIAYTVYANCGGTLIDSDPRVENDGTGHP